MTTTKPKPNPDGQRLKVHLVAGARPNFMKVAPLWHALRSTADFEPVFVHTGQHYDPAMSDKILSDLEMPAPEFQLAVGSGSHADQTGRAMIAYDNVVALDQPDWLIVVGDVNSTLATALVGAKRGIPTVHLEAGLRNGDFSMPEEINRLAIDAVSRIFWTPSADATDNLLREGISPSRITLVGNVMLDSLERNRVAIRDADSATRFGLREHAYGVVTLHHADNVDKPIRLTALVKAVAAAASQLPLVFPVHPRTAARLDATKLEDVLQEADVSLIEPMSYHAFLSLVSDAALVITDSSGLQEETSYLGVPCLTLREKTDRPITTWQGTNTLVSPSRIGEVVAATLSRPRPKPASIPLWDGRAAERCVSDLRRRAAEHAPL